MAYWARGQKARPGESLDYLAGEQSEHGHGEDPSLLIEFARPSSKEEDMLASELNRQV